MMGRRTFCLRSSASLALLAAAPWAVEAKPRRKVFENVPLPGPGYQAFARQLSTTFHVRFGEQSFLPLQLIRAEVKERSPRENPKALDADFERFSLVFAGQRAPLLPQETYTFEHPQLGRFELFIVPVLSRDAARQKYEAIFNRPATN
jgi:hypothetical protein